jgi:tape measure domain-containing protein
MEGGELRMSAVDNRVVEMKFNNAEFERGVRTTLESLANLNKGLQLQGATKGLENISAASGRLSFLGISNGLDTLKLKFGALQTVAVAALGTIASKATIAGQRMISSFSTDPIKDGLKEYETQLNSIQTILSNTQWQGTTMKEVNVALRELNEYSDKTIYNFSEMARNIGTFTAAGVKLDTSVSAIKGIANLAAVSGSSSEQASTAMYQLSQALSTGTVKLMDWNSVVNAGMGGKVFQDALKETARAHGVNIDAIIKKEGSFRDSLQTGWLSSGILTETLNKFTGDMTDAQLKQLGYTDKQIAAIQKMGKTATDAATKVKTFSQLMGTLKEAAGSGWAQTWQLILGDFEEAKTMFTNVYNVLGGAITASAEARNKILGDWKKLGGRTALIDSVSNAFKAFLSVAKPIRDAFREIFPAKTGKDLYNFTVSLREFTKNLKIGADTAANLKRTFAGVFAIFSIAGQVISGVVNMVLRFFNAIGEGSGGFLEFTAGIGDWLVALDEMLKRSGGITMFFQNLGDILAVPVKLLSSVAEVIGNLFDSFDPESGSQLVTTLDGVGDRLEPIARLGRLVQSMFEGLGRAASRVGDVIGNALSGIGDAIAAQLTPQTFSKALSVINTALLGGVVLMIKRFVSGGVQVNVGEGLFGKIKESLGAVTETLTVMQQNLKANILLKIAGALALLTASVVVLGTMDSKDLAKGMAALAVGFVGLQAAMVSISKAVGLLGAAKLPFITVSLIALSAALLLMSLAVRSMAQLELGDMLRGLTGLGLALVIIGKAMKLMPSGPGMVTQAAALTILGVALNAIAIAVRIFATMQWDDMGRGLTALAGALVAIAAGMRLMPKGMLLQAVALTALGVALNEIAIALKIFNTMSWDDMAHGLVALGGALVIIAGAMHLMPRGMLLQAIALVAVAGALNVMALALKLMATMSWEEIGKGLVTLAGAMVILAGGLYLMSGTLAGAAALLIAAGALAVLTPILVTLGSLDISTIAKGLGTLAAIFVILGVAGYALAGALPVIMGLSVALVLIGAGLALAGVGALAFAAAFGIVVAAGAAGVAVLAGILSTFVDAIPMAIEALGIGIVALAEVIAKNGPAFARAIGAIISSILQAIQTNLPKIGATFLRLVEVAAKVLEISVPRFARAGLNMILGVLKAVRDKLPDIIKTAGEIVVNFIDGIAKALPSIIESGINLIISFINGIAEGIREHDQELVDAGTNLAKAIVEGMITGLKGAGGLVADAAKGVAKGALNAAKDFLGIHSPSKEFEKIGVFVNQGFAQGLKKSSPEVQQAYDNMKTLLKNAMKAADEDVENAKAKLEKLTHARKKDNDAIEKATAALAQARKERALSGAAYRTVTQDLDDENAKLKRLANSYEAVSNKLAAAQDKLKDAIKTRDDYKASIKDQYNDLPDIDKETKVQDYISELEKKVKDTQTFAVVLQKLRGLGLNDTAYKDLLAKGVDALPFATELLNGGKDAVTQINTLGSELDKISGQIGKSASTNLYQAGVDAAQGLVNGLKAKQTEIAAQMNVIAKSMVTAIKTALGIKSPSRVFMKMGQFTGDGLVKGLQGSTRTVGKATDAVGQEAIDRMKASMLKMTDIIGKDVDMNPTIKPVLDLTNVKKNSAKLGAMLGAKPISVESTYSSAKFAAEGYSQNQTAAVAPAVDGKPVDLTFIQNNTSPKALSQAEIYRQTRNQISVAKGVLTSANKP